MGRVLFLVILILSQPSDGWAQSLPEAGFRPMILALRQGVEAPAFARDEPLVDWFPASNGFRVTSGRSSDRQGKLLPYLGIGWQGAMLASRVLIGLDMGALYDGRPELRMAEPGRAVSMAEPADFDPSRIRPAFSLTFTYRF